MKILGGVPPKLGARYSVVEQLTKALGGKLVPWDKPTPVDTDIFVAWRLKGTPSYDNMVANGVCLVWLDLGYFDDTRFECYTVSVNGVHGHAMKVPVDDTKRPHPILQPWKHDGDKIQIVSTGFNKRLARKGIIESMYPTGWLEETKVAAEEAFGMPAHIRYHPKELPPNQPTPPPFEQTFKETFCSVTYSSTTAIQTVCAGVPTVVQHPRSPAYNLCTQELEATRPKGREAWIHELSHRNFDMSDPREYAAAAEYIMRAYEHI